MKEAVIKKRQKFHDFFDKIELLDTLDSMEKDKLCDCLKEEKFKPDEYVIKQGEGGDIFYFVIEGNAVAEKEQNGEVKVVYEYSENDYFGEIALLKNEPRAASIKATTNLTTASIDRASFKRLLGPLEDILKRNM